MMSPAPASVNTARNVTSAPSETAGHEIVSSLLLLTAAPIAVVAVNVVAVATPVTPPVSTMLPAERSG